MIINEADESIKSPMENENGMYLSDYLDKNEDILKWGKRTCIVSGVGSGKNHWVEQVLTRYGNVLLITSRKAKKDETIKALENVFVGEFAKDEEGQCIVYTNAGIEMFLKHAPISGSYDNLTRHFDYIVLDEAHSVITDSTFTDASFHVWSFVQKMSEWMKVILMTGTVAPIEELLEKNKWQIINCMDDCINIKPEKIIIDSRKNIFTEIKKKKKSKEKFIYMANSANNIVENLYKDIQKECQIAKEEIAFSMSDDKARKLLKDMKAEYDRLQNTYESIVNNKMIPDDIRLLLTTSRLKEGINIENEDIKYIICESHYISDLLQFAGRVRSGVDILYIVEDAIQNNNNVLQELDYQFCKEVGLNACNEYLEKVPATSEDLFPDLFDIIVSKTLTNRDIRDVIRFVEKRFEYIRYNHLLNKFELYELRHTAVQQAKADLNHFNANYVSGKFGINCGRVENKAIQEREKERASKEAYKDLLEKTLDGSSRDNKKWFDNEKNIIKKAICKGMGIKLTASIAEINGELKTRGLPYQIESKPETAGENRSKRYIQVIKTSSGA